MTPAGSTAMCVFKSVPALKEKMEHICSQQHLQLCQQTHHKLSSLLKRQQLLLALCIKHCKQKASFADEVPVQARKSSGLAWLEALQKEHQAALHCLFYSKEQLLTRLVA